MSSESTEKTIAYWLIIVIGFGWLGYIGAGVIMPITFAVIFAIFLYPLDKWIYQKIKVRWLSIPLSFTAVIVPLMTIGFLFSLQLTSIVESLPAIGATLQSGVQKLVGLANAYLPFLGLDSEKLISSLGSGLMEGPLTFVKQGVISSSSLVVSAAITSIYTFLILYYRRSLANFIIYHFERTVRSEIRTTLTKIKKTVQAYIGGLGLVVIFLAVINSAGLYLIGVKYPLFWGTLAGLLAVIPYLGTALGGMLPFLYSLATSDYSWQPIAVLVFYGFVQFLEGNIITPKIVGDKVNVNPLVAIVALVFFGQYWGVGGVILALPLTSILRIIFAQFEETESLAHLMSTDASTKPKLFQKLADD